MIYMKFPWLPMSVNEMYMHVRKGNQGKGPPITLRVLTAAGRKWKAETLAYVVKTFQPQLVQFQKNVPYAAYYRFITPKLLNKTWPGMAETRYKRFDASNLVKSIEDVVVEASGVDDSNYLLTVCDKMAGPKEETQIRIWNLEEEGCPFYAAAFSL